MRKETAELNRKGDLRRQAEECLKDHGSDLVGSMKEGKDAQALVHELQVHQIELEMQNEELKRAKLEAEDALMKYSDLYDFAPIGLFTLEAKGIILEVNLLGAELLGVARRDLNHQLFCRFIAPKDLPTFYDFLKRSFETGVKQQCELKLIKNAGAEIYVRLEGTAFEDDNHPTNKKDLKIAVIDITERKRSEEELHETKNYLENLIDYANAPIIVWDPSLRIIRFNHAFERLTGLRSAEVLGENLNILFPESSREASLEQICRAMSGEHWESVEIPIMKIEGSVRTILWNSANIYGKDGNAVAATIAQGQDITERKQMEKALQESEQRFRLALQNAPVSVSSQDRDLRFTWAYNQRTARPEEIIGKFDADIFTPEEAAHLTAIKRRVLDENVKAREQMWLDRPGGRMFIDVSFEPIRGETGRAIGVATATVDLTPIKLAEETLSRSKNELELRVQERTEELSQANKRLEVVNVSLIDEIKGHTEARAELHKAKEVLEILNKKLQVEIEEHKQTEEQLLKAKEAAEAAAKAKSEFLANMSHEIRTPLNAIIGFTQLLLDEPLDPVQKDDMELIRINGDALLTIINDILDFSKIESDKVVLEEYQFNLRQCVEESLDLVALKASEKGLNLAYTIDKNVPDTIIGDFSRLRQILANLLFNAVKFTDEGEVLVSVSVDKTNQIHFAVRDTGIGIPRDRMDQLFQPLNQMEPSTTRLYGGTGLGLVISKRLVELMGGRIWAESEVGKGSTFRFTIKTSSGQFEPAAVSPQMIGKRVLIVEDNKTNRRILSKQAYDWGMAPMAASSGQEALRYIQRGDQFDIAVMDIDLQTMDSFELEVEIRKYNKTLPLVLLASLGKRIPPNHAYLTKPIKPSQLHKVLTEILSGQPLPGQPDKASATTSGVGQLLHNRPLKILLAEDNISSQKVALQMLKKLGCNADVVANGIEALQALERQHYDVVFMDLRMPEMDGLEATRIIRQKWPNSRLKVIAITAYALEGDREKCLAAGMDDYISKPVKIEELGRVLKDIDRL